MTNSQHEDSYYLGIDGGGSKTLAIVVDAQGQERGRGRAGSANYASIGLEQAVQNIHDAVDQACQAADCTRPLSKAWLGLAGVDRPADNETLIPHLRSLAAFVHITNDAHLVLSALDNGVGIALIAGTGSIALGRNAEGEVARVGGWGHILGDEGSAYDIGHQALQAAMRVADERGPATVLLDLIMKYWKLSTADEIIGQVYGNEDKAKIAELAPLVFHAKSYYSDTISYQIIGKAVKELKRHITTMRARLNMMWQPVPLAMAGGLLVSNSEYRQLVLEHLKYEFTIGQLAIVEEPALSAARAAINLPTEI